MRIQFILKRNEVYSFVSYCRRSSGLWNSVSFVAEGLRARGVECDIVEVRDNNDIDREVSRFRPDKAIIEALWVVPEKFDVLKRLHPGVEWHVHLHSHMVFLAIEGIAMEWISGYAQRGVGIIANSDASHRALLTVLSERQVVLLHNVYEGTPRRRDLKDAPYGWLNIGCFGAIRPLKNQLLQAMAAIRFAEEKGRLLKFHINSTRTETGGEPVLKNLRALFEGSQHARLVEHPWMEHDEFVDAMAPMLDIGMQVSLTETFSIVSADYTTAGIPMVVSKEIYWASRLCMAQDDSIDSMVKVMHRVYQWQRLVDWNQRLLRRHSRTALQAWLAFANA
jgi:hypothetical protein